MKEWMAVFDRDEIYAERLARALQRDPECPYTAVRVTEAGELSRLRGEGRIALLLLGEGAEEQSFDRTLADRTVRLTAYREDGTSEGEEMIFKYQPVSEILKGLLTFPGRPEEKAERTGRGGVPESGVIGVASPVGRCGKSAFAMTLARLLSERKNVLFCDLTAVSGLYGLYGSFFPRTLSDLLYAERVGLADEFTPGSFIVKQWGLEIAPPAESPEAVFDTPPKEIVRALEHLFLSRPYEAAVLDLSDEYHLIREFLPKLGKLYVPTLQDELSRVKTDAFLRWVRKETEKRGLPLETVELPEVPQGAPGADPVEGLLFSEMGDAVRKMLFGEL